MTSSARVLIRRVPSKVGWWWGTIRLIPLGEWEETLMTFCYDTSCFPTVTKVKEECRAFCKWKGLRIRKYVVEK